MEFSLKFGIAKLKIMRKVGNRNWTKANAYRPISLLTTVGKIHERLVALRLTSFVEENELSIFQHIVWKGTDIIDVINKLKNIAQKTKLKFVMAIFVDIQVAYDAVWWLVIMEN